MRKEKLKRIAQYYSDKSKLERARKLKEIWDRIFRNEHTLYCPKCLLGEMKRFPEKDEPFDKNTLDGIGFWECWKCGDCGYEEYAPFD